MKNIICFFIFFILTNPLVLGQIKDSCYTIPIKDTSLSTINSRYFKLLKKGFLTPNLKIIKQDSTLFLSICTGKKYAKIYIRNKNEKTIESTPKETGTFLENQFNQLINNGFPFAKLYLDSITFETNHIQAQLRCEKGPFFQWGNLVIKGNAKINEQILRGILDLKTEAAYSEEVFKNIESKINQLPYLSVFQKTELLFENGKVDVYLYVNSKPINTLSGTVGLQQNPISQNYFLIGDLKMKLVNQLRRGEILDFQWRRIQESTQSLKIGLNYPSLFNSNFGIDNQFNLYKKDTTFLEIKNQFGVQYFSPKGYIIKANYKYIESNILNSNANNSILGKSINNLYGISFFKQKLDYIPAPKTGFQFSIDISLGKRQTSRSDSLKNKFDNTFKSEYQFVHYLNFLRRNVLKTQFSGEIYLAPFYYQNELIRFGGLQYQRGFREDELLGNIRITQSIEYRFMLEQNSYLFSYFDISYYENHVKTPIYATPFGFGSGMSFGTPQGIFSISYALGKQFNNPILLKNGIIHFGYISYF